MKLSATTFGCLVTLALLTCAGCQTMNPLSGTALPWTEKDKVVESKYQSPARLVAIWTDASYNSAGKKPVRGFGGRLYFYNDKQHPVPVEGQLVVYAYDDTDARSPAQQPCRKYVFTPEQLTEHFGETDLGASYSIWLPWDELGGEQKNISLVPILTSSSGQVLTGAQSLNLLPGTKPDMPEEQYFSRVEPESAGARKSLSKVQPTAYRHPLTAESNAVATAGFESSEGAAGQTKTLARMETTTIKPTGRLAERLLAQRNEAIVQRGLQRYESRAASSLPPARLEENHAPLATPAPAGHGFSKRPGEQYPSRIYSARQ